MKDKHLLNAYVPKSLKNKVLDIVNDRKKNGESGANLSRVTAELLAKALGVELVEPLTN
jgi:peptide subunit release factor 1 (eRF1)